MNISQKKLPKILALLLAFLLSAPLGVCVTASAEGEEAQPAGERILHVKAGGEGDGSTAEAPMADIGGAFSALSESGHNSGSFYVRRREWSPVWHRPMAEPGH